MPEILNLIHKIEQFSSHITISSRSENIEPNPEFEKLSKKGSLKFQFLKIDLKSLLSSLDSTHSKFLFSECETSTDSFDLQTDSKTLLFFSEKGLSLNESKSLARLGYEVIVPGIFPFLSGMPFNFHQTAISCLQVSGNLISKPKMGTFHSLYSLSAFEEISFYKIRISKSICMAIMIGIASLLDTPDDDCFSFYPKGYGFDLQSLEMINNGQTVS